MSIPTKTTVLIIGGGPAGSYAASVLARRNVDTVVLEADKFPRYHIGESLLASTNYFLEYIGARDKVLAHGFVKKPGGAFKLRKDFPAQYTNFIDHNTGSHAFNVNRAEYDELLFKHAAEQGAKVYDEHKVTQLQFSQQDSLRPVSAEWESKANNTSGTIQFDYLIDASGRQGMLSTKYHRDREFIKSLKNSAIWAYWKGSKRYGEGTERDGAPFIEVLDDNTGWCWYIPINDGTVGIGFVLHEQFLQEKKAGKTMEELYMSMFDLVTDATMYRAEGTLLPNKSGKGGPVYMASDYSYTVEDVAHLNYRIIGDAAAFIDPFFSSGVHLAFVGALSAALSITAVIDGKVTEERSAEFHSAEVKVAFLRFFMVVMAGYKQMRGGLKVNVLNDIDEKDFERAFDVIRPVIQGTGDIGMDNQSTGQVELSEEELRGTMDFVFRLFVHPPPGGKVVEHEDDGLHGNVDDLDKDARVRLKKLSQHMAPLLGHDGVTQTLNSAQEQMRISILKAN